MSKKIDLRFNEIKKAIIEIGDAFSKCELSNRGVAILICDANKKLSLKQVEAVLEELPRLSEKYIKK